MSLWEAFLLGLIQAITEFLPISSDGHLELGKLLLRVKNADNLTFTIIVHGGTTLSIITVFWKDIVELLRGIFTPTWNDSKRFAVWVLISMVPVGIVGVFFKDEIEEIFLRGKTESAMYVIVGACLLANGFILLLNHLPERAEQPISGKVALWMGLAQAVAVLPGISRSGCTLTTARLLGVRPAEAARFSFLMVVPPILGMMLLETKDLLEAPSQALAIGTTPLILGFLTSFLIGIVACRFLLVLVRKQQLYVFGYYCLAIGFWCLWMSQQ
jgi:undecaprenyl-diphosphatase